MTITESERLALCDILADYLRREGHIQEFVDVTHEVTTTIEGLLVRLVAGDQAEKTASSG